MVGCGNMGSACKCGETDSDYTMENGKRKYRDKGCSQPNLKVPPNLNPDPIGADTEPIPVVSNPDPVDLIIPKNNNNIISQVNKGMEYVTKIAGYNAASWAKGESIGLKDTAIFAATEAVYMMAVKAPLTTAIAGYMPIEKKEDATMAVDILCEIGFLVAAYKISNMGGFTHKSTMDILAGGGGAIAVNELYKKYAKPPAATTA